MGPRASASQYGVATSVIASGLLCCQLPNCGRLPVITSRSPSCRPQSLHRDHQPVACLLNARVRKRTLGCSAWTLDFHGLALLPVAHLRRAAHDHHPVTILQGPVPAPLQRLAVSACARQVLGAAVPKTSAVEVTQGPVRPFCLP